MLTKLYFLSPNPNPTPYRKPVCIVTLSNKNNLLFFYNFFIIFFKFQVPNPIPTPHTKLSAILGYIHTKPELSLSNLFFPSSQEISTYTRNHETDTKRCSIHARPVCGAVILPQRYTKMEKKTWTMCINLARDIQTNMEQHIS